MLREIAVPKSEDFVLHIPREYLHKKIEFIAFPIEDKKATSKVKRRSGRGLLKGKVRMSDDFDAPLDDFKEYM